MTHYCFVRARNFAKLYSKFNCLYKVKVIFQVYSRVIKLYTYMYNNNNLIFYLASFVTKANFTAKLTHSFMRYLCELIFRNWTIIKHNIAAVIKSHTYISKTHYNAKLFLINIRNFIDYPWKFSLNHIPLARRVKETEWEREECPSFEGFQITRIGYIEVTHTQRENIKRWKKIAFIVTKI